MKVEKIENQHLLIVLIVLILNFILKQQPKQEKYIVRKRIGNGLRMKVVSESYLVAEASWLKVVFCKRFMVFNKTFALVGGSKYGNDKATGVFWHEGIRGWSAVDVATTSASFIRKNWDTKDSIFWLDNSYA